MKTITVLIIEDDPGDVDYIKETLQKEGHHGLSIELAVRLSEGIERLSKGVFDVILLDLTLPDSSGIDSFLTLFSKFPDIPIVVLSGIEDDAFASQAVFKGAQDYLIKSRLDGYLLIRSIRYAIERHRLQVELEKSRQLQRHKDEIQSFEGLHDSAKTTVTSKMFGKVPVKEEFSDIFTDLVGSYNDLLEKAVDKRIYKSNHTITEGLLSISEKLGFLKAGPRDVVELHSEVIKQKIGNINFAKAQLYIEEGRLTLLELMGNLVSFYRNYYFYFRKPEERKE